MGSRDDVPTAISVVGNSWQGSGNDPIVAQNGSDIIVGGYGADILTGGFGDTDGNVATAEFTIRLSNFNGFAAYENPMNVPPSTLLDGCSRYFCQVVVVVTEA